jgi:hypothetical protein
MHVSPTNVSGIVFALVWAATVRLGLTTSACRLQGELPGPRESATDHMSRSDNSLGHLGVQERPHVSATVVSTVLAAGLSIQRTDLPLPWRGVTIAANMFMRGGRRRIRVDALSASVRLY